jgi:hypothetical protein
MHPAFLLGDITQLPWVAIIAVAGGMILTIVVIVGGLIFAHRRQALWHETARLALEKGQPLPQLPDEDAPEPAKPRDTTRRDLRAGLILIGVGAGLFVFFNAFIGRGLAYVGAIPGFIGAALVLFAILNSVIGRPPADRP